MKKSLSLSMLIVGTIVGAGFASGREIVSFFGQNMSPWIAPACGLVFFVLNVLFLMIGRKLKKPNLAEVNKVFLGRFHLFADFFLILNSLVVLAGTLSGINSLLNMVFPIAPFYSIMSGILCAIVASKGLKGIIKCNAIVVPIIIIFLITVCSLNITGFTNPAPFYSYNLPAVLMYVSMNMMLACAFFVTLHDLDKKTIIVGSLIASVIITVLMYLLIRAINSSGMAAEALPVLEMAKQTSKPLFYVCLSVIAVSIFTTMLTSMSSLSLWVGSFLKSEVFSMVVVLVAGLIVSNLGFENVVAYLYPLIGLIGIAYIAIGIVYMIKNSKPPNIIRKLARKKRTSSLNF